MSATRAIGDKEFRRRKVNRSVRIELAALQDDIQDIVDRMGGLEAEIDHAGNAIDALAGAEGEFNAKERDALIKRRKDLRKKLRELTNSLIDLQLQVVAKRLDPSPEPAFLDDHSDERELLEITEWLDSDEKSEPS